MAEVKAKKSGNEKPSVELRHEDGPGGLKSLLPPPSRRGLILIDPSWEDKSEFENIPRAIDEGLSRFPEGIFIVWYPLLNNEKYPSERLKRSFYDVSRGKHCCVELYTGPAAARVKISPRGMYGSGLVIYNPPWTLEPGLRELMPHLANVLGGAEGDWYIDWNA
jgi:23S rRNA (adenine2030-N6)-methyltransferase